MRRLYNTLVWLAVCGLAILAQAAPTASFTARKTQGDICVAPCVVHFDAIGMGALSPVPYVTPETTDPVYDREFHSLHFEWDFGDPGSGNWTTGAAARTSSPQSKNYDIGGIAGHLYENPGTYVVTLTVTNPAGEVSTTTRTVFIADRTTYFSAANTFCFANDDSNWAGCPLNCATDDNCTVLTTTTASPNLRNALQDGDNCSGTDDCANADQGGNQRRLLFRRGGTYRLSNFVRMNENAGTPGIIEAFGTGERPIFNLGGAPLEAGDNWTFVDLQITNPSTAALYPNAYCTNDTWIRVRVFDRGGPSCIDETLSWPPGTHDVYGLQRSFYDVDCDADDTSMNAHSIGYWPGAKYGLFMGGRISQDPNNIFESAPGTADRFTMRGKHLQHYLISHSDFVNTSAGRGGLQQFRHADDTCWGGVCDLGPVSSARYNIISDNWIEDNGQENGWIIRICVDGNCGCTGSTCYNAGTSQGYIVPVHDYIFERNFHSFPRGTPTTLNSLYQILGGDITIRNETWDLSGGTPSSGFVFALVHGDPQVNDGNPLTNNGTTPSGNIHIYNNTLYFSHTMTGNFSFGSIVTAGGSSGCPDTTRRCRIYNNLFVAPNHSGVLTTPSGFTSNNNTRITTPNPFVATVPVRGSSVLDDFVLALGSAPVGTGYDFTVGTDLEYWVHDDAMRLCRPGNGDGWDVGAHEFGAVECSGVSATLGGLRGGMLRGGTLR